MPKKPKLTKAQRSARMKAVWAERRAAKPAAKPKGDKLPNKLPNVEWVTDGSTDIYAAVAKQLKKTKTRVDESPPVSFLLTVPGYDMLANELHEAFVQSAHGKGKERHSNGKPFDRQPILELGRLYGPGFATGQAAKKAQEALGMLHRGERDKAIFELHGAIVYLAAAAGLIREGEGG